MSDFCDRLCGLVVRVLGYRSGGPGSIPGITRKKKVAGLERGALSLVSISVEVVSFVAISRRGHQCSSKHNSITTFGTTSTTEELLDRKVAAPV
jgi:hypothetical protein